MLGAGLLALAGCGPLAPAVDEAVNPTVDALGTCCRGLDRAQFARLSSGQVIDVPAGEGVLARGALTVTVEAVAVPSQLDPQLASALTWDSGESIVTGDETHELVLALVAYTAQESPAGTPATGPAAADAPPTRAGGAPGAGTGVGAPEALGGPFTLRTLDPRTAAGSLHEVDLFEAGAGAPQAMSVVVVARIRHGVDVWLASPDPALDSPEVNLRTGRART